MGLLEQLLARLDALNARLDKLENGQPVSVTIENNTDATLTVRIVTGKQIGRAHV